ncbi:unnamed protein product, partial [marine sediment metagenome]
TLKGTTLDFWWMINDVKEYDLRVEVIGNIYENPKLLGENNA